MSGSYRSMSQNNNSEDVKHYWYLTSNFPSECDSCHRFKEDGETGCLDLEDGRELCSDCSSIAVTNSYECNSIIQSVLKFYKIEELKVDEKIPIFFIDKNHMRRFRNRSQDNPLGVFIPSIWDININCIISRLIISGIQTIEKYSRSGGDNKKVWKLALGRTIIILFGKPDIEIGAILAHEMMHAWICGQGIPYMGDCKEFIRTEEGLCEFMAHKWLEWFPSSGFDNSHKTNKQVQYTEELRESLVNNIQCKIDDVYGQGFKDALRAIETFGFKPTLDYFVKYRTLPQPMMDSTCSAAASTTAKELESFIFDGIRSRGYKFCVRVFIAGIRAIGTVGFRPTLDHLITYRSLPQLMMDSTCSTNASATSAAAELTRKNTSATPQPDHVLCKASGNTTKSYWVATTIDFIGKTATICEAIGIIMMKGYLLSIGIGIQIEHS
uniref:protein DA1-like n=1 Tax=Fragaria vesca subsp. vesca TaxID=101020 RepID=UPI0005C8C1F9|nr:PREDICTED: protein DA1-like [Fragaria vesca subsp. vesca]